MTQGLRRQDRARHPGLGAGLGAVPRAEGAGRARPTWCSSSGTTWATAPWTASAARCSTPTMSRIADRGVRYSNFHTTALCSPTRASLLTGRNATSNGMATIAEFSSGLPRHLDPDPVRERVHLRGAASSTATTPTASASGTSPPVRRPAWPRGRSAGRWVAGSSGSTGSSAASRAAGIPDLIHDNHPIGAAGDAGGGLPHRQGPLGQGDRVHPRRQGRRAGEAVLPVLLARRRARAAPRVPGVGRQVQGRLRRGLRGDPRRDPGPAEGARAAARGHRAVRRSTRTASPASTGPDGQPWPMLDTVRPWESLSADEKRLFVRMAEVFAGYVEYTDDQVGRVIDFLEASGELDNTIIVVVSDNGASGEGGPERHVQRVALLQRRADADRAHARAHRRARQPEVVQPLQHRLGLGVRHPVPLLEAVGRLRGRHRRHVPGLVAGAGRAVQRGPRTQYVHAVDVVPTIYDLHRHHPAASAQRLRAAPDRGRELRGLAHRRRRPPASAPSSTRCSASARSTRTAGWPAPLHPPLSSWGKFDQDVWELYHVEVDRSQSTNLADAGARTRRSRWWPGGSSSPSSTTGCRSTTATRWSRCSPSDPAAHPPGSGTSTTRTARPCPSSRRWRSAAARTRSRPGVQVDSADAEGVIFAHGGVAGGHSLFVQDRAADTTSSTGSARTCRRSPPTAAIEPGPHVVTAEFVAEGRSEDPMMPGCRGTLTLYVDGEARRQRDDRHPAGRLLRGRATGSASAATTPPRCRRPTPRRSASPAAASTRWSSTCPASGTSTTRPRCGAGSCSTDGVAATHRRAGRRFEAAGVASFVREEGDGDPVVLMHGLPASSFLYRKVIPELAARGLRAIAFDLPGWGSPTAPRASTTRSPALAGGPGPRSRRSASTGSTSWSTTPVARSASRWWRTRPVASAPSRSWTP